MDLILGNPTGLWALLGVPALLAIHLLQRRVRTHRVSTLFLLENLPMNPATGRVVERIRNSAALWLQLLAVLVVTWLLAQPRWLREDSFQRVVLVLDSSWSMSAFLDRIGPEASRDLRALAGSAAFTEWSVVESDVSAATLYSGPDLERVRDAIRAWRPRLGHHDPVPALRAAQGLVGTGGRVIFLSDHVPESVPAGVQVLAVGRAFVNCGFAGLRVQGDGDEAEWRALVRNHGDEPARRAWWVETAVGASERQDLELNPGELRTLRGGFPPGADRITVRLEDDAFSMDDHVPVVRPAPKRLKVDVAVEPMLRPMVQRLLATVTAADAAPGGARPDVEFLSYLAPAPPGLRANAVCFPRPFEGGTTPAPGWITAEDHRLMRGLSWQGLLVDQVAPVTVREQDEVLVWQGTDPLLLLRSGERGRQLVFTFDVSASNAPRLPAFVLLVHRFLEEVRDAKQATESGNVELRQRLALASDPDGPDVRMSVDSAGGEDEEVLPADRAPLLRAPDRPSHFTVHQGSTILFRGAARFADLREADFTNAETRGGLDALAREQRRLNSRPDPLGLFWLLLVVGLLAGSWHVSREGEA